MAPRVRDQQLSPARGHARTQSRPAAGRQKPLTRAAFYAHLWLGVIFTLALVVISVTGILLNHKRGLGLMPDVPHEPTQPFTTALPLSQLAEIALDTVARAAGRESSAVGEVMSATIDIDRMDVRPRDGFVKVRMRDASSTEVTVDLTSGRVLHVGPRGDVFLEKLHSGEIFGGLRWVLLSDAAAIALVITLITGYWLWLVPKRPRPGRDARTRQAPPGDLPPGMTLDDT